MAKFIGKNMRVKVGGVDLTDHVAAVTINESVDEIETTAFNQSNRSRIGGLADASVTLSMHSDYASTSVNETIGTILGGTTTVTVLMGTALSQGTAAAGAPLYTVTALASNFDTVTAQVGDLSTVDVTWPAVTAVTKSTSGTF
jgi:hypothetical protein